MIARRVPSTLVQRDVPRRDRKDTCAPRATRASPRQPGDGATCCAMRSFPRHRAGPTCPMFFSAAWCSKVSSACRGSALRHRGHQQAGLRDRAHDGLRRFACLHRDLCIDRHRLPGSHPREGWADGDAKSLSWDRCRDLAAVAAMVAYTVLVLKKPQLRATGARCFHDATAMASSIVLLLCLGLTMLDSIHYRPCAAPAGAAANAGAGVRVAHQVPLDAAMADRVASARRPIRGRCRMSASRRNL